MSSTDFDISASDDSVLPSNSSALETGSSSTPEMSGVRRSALVLSAPSRHELQQECAVAHVSIRRPRSASASVACVHALWSNLEHTLGADPMAIRHLSPRKDLSLRPAQGPSRSMTVVVTVNIANTGPSQGSGGSATTPGTPVPVCDGNIADAAGATDDNWLWIRHTLNDANGVAGDVYDPSGIDQAIQSAVDNRSHAALQCNQMSVANSSWSDKANSTSGQ